MALEGALLAYAVGSGAVLYKVVDEILADHDAAFAATGVEENFALEIMASPLALLVMLNFALALLGVIGRALVWLFFGALRANEARGVKERLRDNVLTAGLVLMVLFERGILADLPELVVWAACFAIIGFLSQFASLAKDRFAHVATVLANVDRLAHLRLAAILVLTLVADLAWFATCVTVFSGAGASILFLLTFGCLIVLLSTLQTLAKYAIHAYDLHVGGTFAQRGHLSYYAEFVTDSLTLVGTLAHYVHILLIHGVSFTLIDLVLLVFVKRVFTNLRAKLAKYRNYRAALNRMDVFPDATADELRALDDACAICREVMAAGAKRLPCGHYFHLACVRTWLEEQQTCPTCRRSVLDDTDTAAVAAAAAAAATVGGGGGAGAAHGGGNQGAMPGAPLNAASVWSQLLPGLSFNVQRRTLPNVDEAAAALHEAFPQVPLAAIAADLRQTGSREVTSENILSGRVRAGLGGGFGGSGGAVPVVTPQPGEGFGSTARTGTPSVATATAATATTATTAASPPARGSTPVVIPERTEYDENLASPVFASTPSERQLRLTERKKKLMADARRKFLAKKKARAGKAKTEPSAPATTTMAPADAREATRQHDFPPAVAVPPADGGAGGSSSTSDSDDDGDVAANMPASPEERRRMMLAAALQRLQASSP